MISPRSYESPSSVWEIVCEQSAPSEHHELKQLIGADLIDQTVELRKEIDLLLELALDLQDDDRPREIARPAAPARLPEPPQMRERLAQEIVFFLETIREQSKQQGGSDRLDLKRLELSQDVVDYAYESSSSRPSTGTSRLSLGEIRVTPASSRSGSRRTARSSVGGGGGGGGDGGQTSREEVTQMRDQLTYMRCDEVQKKLRLHLQEEIEQLKLDLELLQDGLAAGGNGPASARSITGSAASPPPPQMMTSREPSLADLRSERHKLERAVLSACKEQPALRRLPTVGCHGNQQQQQQHLHSNKAANETIPRLEPLSSPPPQPAGDSTQRLSSAQRLRSMVRQSRQQEQHQLPLLHQSEMC